MLSMHSAPPPPHRAPHESLDGRLFVATVVAEVALALIEVVDQQGLAITEYPADKPLARGYGGSFRDHVAKAERGGYGIDLRIVTGKEEDSRIGIKDTADDTENMFVALAGVHIHFPAATGSGGSMLSDNGGLATGWCASSIALTKPYVLPQQAFQPSRRRNANNAKPALHDRVFCLR